MGRNPQVIKKNRVKKILKEEGRSQVWLIKKLAETKTPMSQNTVNKVANNKRNLSIFEMDSLTKVLGVTVKELFMKGVDIPILK
jgi:transcriptional regulator with XRE-family HTH domain